jgi:hypothetical protein
MLLVAAATPALCRAPPVGARLDDQPAGWMNMAVAVFDVRMTGPRGRRSAYSGR